MSNVLVKIEKAVPTDIFELPQIKLRVDELFDEMKGDIRARFDEVKAFITKTERDKERYGMISYDEIVDSFKIYFYKSILNEVVEITFTQSGKYNVMENILEVLSDQKLKDAVFGKQMIDAFGMAIRKIPSDSGLVKTLHGSTMLLLEKEFLGKSFFTMSMKN